MKTWVRLGCIDIKMFGIVMCYYLLSGVSVRSIEAFQVLQTVFLKVITCNIRL